MKAAILLTCFNRREKTLACLDSVYRQIPVTNITSTIYLVDDGSSDGTTKAVSDAYPDVNILTGNGKLYWNGGMNYAWRTAIQKKYDFYIWINDDVYIHDDALQVLFDTFYKGAIRSGSDPVVIGCFREEATRLHSYGGFSLKKTLLGIKTTRKLPNGSIQRCDTFNGNFVLIPNSVVDDVGLLDDRYTHAFGDKDYGYRCTEHNVPIYMTPTYVGECSRDNIAGSWTDPDLTLSERHKRMKLPTGLPPEECFYSYRKNSNSIAAIIAVLKLYLRLLFPRLWGKLSRKEQGE
jgi:GT2 family glycosyltransferase